MAERELADIGAVAARLANLTPEIHQAAAAYAAEEMRPLIVRTIMENYKRSGIKERTGKLAAGIAATIVKARVGQRGPEIVIRMPGGSGYTYGGEKQTALKGGAHPAPKVWASLNYGAVRAGTEARAAVSSVRGSTAQGASEKRMALLGQKAKRTVKAYALGGKISDRAIGRIEQDVRIGGQTQRKGFSIGTVKDRGYKKIGSSFVETSVTLSGGAVVIRPKPFWELTPSQRRAIRDQFSRVFIRHLARLAG